MFARARLCMSCLLDIASSIHHPVTSPREMALPIADCLGIPKERVFANRMLWQWDDETMEPSRLVGFDMSEPTARNQGKPQAIALIRQQNPYNSVRCSACSAAACMLPLSSRCGLDVLPICPSLQVVMIGDGITDLEAVQVSGGADLFIG